MPTKPEAPSRAERSTSQNVLELNNLSVHFKLQGSALARLFGFKARLVRAVDDVSVSLKRGEVLGLVGESGSGKTTLGRALLGLAPATEGEIHYHGKQGDRLVSDMRGKELRELRTALQMVFQDPNAALNPSMTIEAAVGHPLVIHGIAKGAELRRLVAAALERVGLSPVDNYLSKYPSDLSGGQKQRAVIARAIILDPEVLVADEPVSMLDMSVRAKIIQLMIDLKRDMGLTYVYITHDLASAKFFCDRIAIMYLGRIVEIGPTEEIFANPRHPYTKALLKAIPEPDPERMVARDLPRGEIPDAAEPPLGCSFHPRCPEATSVCGWESRDLRAVVEEHWTRRTPEEYDAETKLVGNLDHLDQSATEVTFGNGSPAEIRALIDRMKAEKPNEPFWKGVSSIDDDGNGVRLRFFDGVDPALRRAGGVDVACVLYPDGSGTGSTDG